MSFESSERDAVIVSYRRTPFVRARKGSFVAERPEDLALTAIRSALADVPALSDKDFDDFFLGTAVPQGAQGDNAARRLAIYGNLDAMPGVTINRFCASSVEALTSAARGIRSGDGDVYLVGGMESTSSTPPTPTDMYPGSEIAAERVRKLFESGEPWKNPRDYGDTPDVYIPMGLTAEFVAQTTGTTRTEQDKWALQSQMRAAAALGRNYFDNEIAPHTLRDGSVVSHDDGPRPATTLDVLGQLKPVFREDGTVTAGNASPLNDGASAAVVMSAGLASALGIAPIARILGSAAGAISPEVMGLGPISATKKLLERLGLVIDNFDLVELNEAFAAQVVPSVQQLGINPERVNVNGGAIALGHPFGATGVRLAGTLARSLQERDESLGLVTLCVGGGQGVAMALERMS